LFASGAFLLVLPFLPNRSRQQMPLLFFIFSFYRKQAPQALSVRSCEEIFLPKRKQAPLRNEAHLLLQEKARLSYVLSRNKTEALRMSPCESFRGAFL
jgi:hypothetical protein